MPRSLCAVLALLCAASVASAELYPSKAIKFVVPFGPGSGSDVTARAFGKYLQDRWKQPVVIENRPGANGLIGTEVLKRAAPDGYTLGFSTNSTVAAAPYLFKNLNYNPLEDFEHVGVFFTAGSVALVAASSPFKSIPALVAHSKANPGKVFFGYSDTSSQIPAELLRATAGISIEGVPYKTISGALVDLMGGQVQFMFANYVTASAQIAGGRLVPIAITEAKRSTLWPDVATVAETYPGFELRGFIALAAPRGTRQDIVEKLNQAMRDALADPTFTRPLVRMGVTLAPFTIAEYREFLLKETQRWKEYIAKAKIELQ